MVSRFRGLQSVHKRVENYFDYRQSNIKERLSDVSQKIRLSRP